MGKWFLKTLSQKKKIREDRAGEIFLKGEGGTSERERKKKQDFIQSSNEGRQTGK
jgi:hypothetical protein